MTLVKSRKTPLSVIPAKAGIQIIKLVTKALDSGFHRSDDFLRLHQIRYPHKNPRPGGRGSLLCPAKGTQIMVEIKSVGSAPN